MILYVSESQWKTYFNRIYLHRTPFILYYVRMINPTLPEMSRKVYEAMEWHIEQDHWINGSRPMIMDIKVIRLGDVLEWIEKNDIEQRELDKQIARKGKDTQFTYTSVINQVLWYRPKDHLSQPIPLDPDESRRPLLEFLLWLI